MKIVMLGTGYVGLVSGACFSDFGFDVTCLDKDKLKIKNLKNGVMPIFEPGLEDLVKKNFLSGRLKFSTDQRAHVKNADAVFIAVGTPTRRGDGHADLTYVYDAAKEIASYLNGYTVIVTKSTVPVGTSQKIKEIIKKNTNAEFDVVSNPEFLREGSAIEDFMRPNRVVVGHENKKSKTVLASIYKPLFLFETPILYTDLKSAELIKYASNAFLAVKISFINQMADLCEQLDTDINDIAKGMGLDKRIGNKFLHPGPGYGGSCFPKDTLALVQTSKQNDVNLSIVETVVRYNRDRKKSLARKIINLMGGDVTNKKISVLGLSFKPGTDDMRESPSLDLIPELLKKKAKITAFDPVAKNEAKKFLKKIKYAESIHECIKGSDCVVLLTEWSEFRSLSPEFLSGLMEGKYIFDFRNVLDPNVFKKSKFKLYQIGREKI